MILSLLLLAACVLAAGFYAGAETGAYRVNRIRLRAEAEKGWLLARLTRRCVADMERFVCMTLTGQNIAVYGATAFCTALTTRRIGSHLTAELLSTLLLAPTLLVAAEVVPKSLYQVLANPLMRLSSPFLWLSDILLRPVVWLLMAVVGAWRRVLVGPGGPRQVVVSAQYLSTLLSAGTQEGVITSQQDTMARNILQLGTRPLRDVMTPLQRVHMLPMELSGEAALRRIGEFGHARLPVYEGAPENVIGILRAIDYLCEGAGGPVKASTRPPMFLDAGLAVDDAFRLLQEAGQTMSVVTASARAVGMVTIDDLLHGLLKRIGT
jgi:CBS domain containing-hemolysin-like protein